MTKKITIKTIIIGDSFSGKTSILNKYINKNFNNIFMATIGVDFYKSIIIRNNNEYKMTIWDTSGQEKFNSIINSYYRNIGVVIIVFDLTYYNSFLNIKNWLENLELYDSDNLIKIVVGNKCDLINQRKVGYRDAKEFCNDNNMSYIESSAKENINIENIFINLVDIIEDKITNCEYMNKNIKIVDEFEVQEIPKIKLTKNKKKCCKIS